MSKPTGIDRPDLAERRERSAVQCHELRYTQPFADGPLGELMPETNEVAVELQHSALEAFLDRSKITVRDLSEKRRLARLTEHGRGSENLLPSDGKPAKTSEHCIADGGRHLALSGGGDFCHEERVPGSRAVKGDGIQAFALYKNSDGIDG
ncbi:MAG: hypothetical protein M3Q92_12785 [Actinomycetota bacterium]|nr:hypothetical protein [Actinomycetota bacterium]